MSDEDNGYCNLGVLESFCPLCGSHPTEQGEGTCKDSKLLLWEKEIEQLYARLQEAKKLVKGEKDA